MGTFLSGMGGIPLKSVVKVAGIGVTFVVASLNSGRGPEVRDADKYITNYGKSTVRHFTPFGS